MLTSAEALALTTNSLAYHTDRASEILQCKVEAAATGGLHSVVMEIAQDSADLYSTIAVDAGYTVNVSPTSELSEVVHITISWG